MAIDPVKFDDYEKITDDVYQISNNLILRFCVVLNKLNLKNNRVSFHKEFKYTNKTGDTVITLRRRFEYFFTLENLFRTADDTKTYIVITVQDYYLVLDAIKEAVSWFRDKKWSNLFVLDNGILRVTNPAPSVTVSPLAMNKWLKFEPCVIDSIRTSSESEPGILITLGDSNNYVKVTLSKFMGLYYIFNKFNMFESAQMMINYLQRPDYGTHMVDFNSES